MKPRDLVAADPSLPACGAIIKTESGDTVTPCHKPKGHEPPHEVYCLCVKAIWTDEDAREAAGRAAKEK